MLPVFVVGRGDEGFQRGIARALAGKLGIHAPGAVLHRNDGVGDAEREVVVGMDSTFGLILQDLVIGLQAGAEGFIAEMASRVPPRNYSSPN